MLSPLVKPDSPNILLINPWIHDFAAYDFWSKPLGLLTLAAILRSHGYGVAYIDCLDRFHPRAPKTDLYARYGRGPYLKTAISKPPSVGDVPRNFSRYGIKPAWFKDSLTSIPPPDLVLMTSLMTYWYPGIQETVKYVRAMYPKTPVALGGIYASLCFDHAAASIGAEKIASGSGERQIFGLVEEYTGFSATPKFDPDRLDTYPYPAFDLQHKITYIPLLTSRGCPFSCAYCASRFLHPKRMLRTPESVVEEVSFWHKEHYVVDFVLYDDAFLVDAQNHAVPILEGIIKSGIKLRFHTPNAVHIRGITHETARLMFAAGFQTLRLGLETTAFESRDELDRKVTAEEFKSAVSYLKDAGFKKDQVGAYLLAGLPGQSIRSLETSMKTVLQSNITPVPAYYSPIPHTALWDTAVASSRYDLPSDPIFSNNAILPCRKEAFSWETITHLKRLSRSEKTDLVLI